jgi:hypothetical protein
LAETASANRQEAPGRYSSEYFDSVEVSLLTCEPHDEVYSLYGHTALRWHDRHASGGTDLTFNYGVFDWRRPHFVARFIMGLTDYELGAYPYPLFLKEYQHFGSMVTEQVLNLNSREKARLQQALMLNLQPANRIYRYNYFYNNCTTKARDIIEQCIDGTLEYADNKRDSKSYRDMVHEMTRHHPWSRFGNDLLLGIRADQPTTQRQQEFLPGNLMADFDHAKITDNGEKRPLVSESRTALPAGTKTVQPAFPLSPWQCSIILGLAAIALCAVQLRRKQSLLWWDATLMLATGTVGIVLSLMLFSQHPTVSLNLQLILLNPLPWCFLWPVMRRRPSRRYWQATAILSVLFLVGALFQHYAEGIHVVALCLLLQCYVHLKTDIKQEQTSKKHK